MSIITEIKVAKGKKARRHIYIDGNFVATLDEFTVYKYRIHEGLNIDLETLEQISFESEANSAFEQSVNLISKNPKTSRQMYDYLKSKGYLPRLIRHTIDKLIEYHYLDDGQYAKNFVNVYSTKYGKRKIQFLLASKGIPQQIINDTLAELDSQEDTACEYAKKYMKGKEITQQNCAKLARHLAGKGFDWAEINSALNTIKRIKDEDWN